MASINFNKQYFPEDKNNMSYEEISYFLYGIDIDEKEEKDE